MAPETRTLDPASFPFLLPGGGGGGTRRPPGRLLRRCFGARADSLAARSLSTLQTFSFPLGDVLPPPAAHETEALGGAAPEKRARRRATGRARLPPPHAPRHGGCMICY
uniref:Uncharacterized protein n=1 Tax=Arundo donax TaxID=35708 RepID=A0A0A9GEF2_ARUDO